MTATTETISAALRRLAAEIEAPDSMPAAALCEAADRLDVLSREHVVLYCVQSAVGRLLELIGEDDQAAGHALQYLHYTLEQWRVVRDDHERGARSPLRPNAWGVTWDAPDADGREFVSWWPDRADANESINDAIQVQLDEGLPVGTWHLVPLLMLGPAGSESAEAPV